MDGPAGGTGCGGGGSDVSRTLLSLYGLMSVEVTGESVRGESRSPNPYNDSLFGLWSGAGVDSPKTGRGTLNPSSDNVVCTALEELLSDVLFEEMLAFILCLSLVLWVLWESGVVVFAVVRPRRTRFTIMLLSFSFISSLLEFLLSLHVPSSMEESLCRKESSLMMPYCCPLMLGDFV